MKTIYIRKMISIIIFLCALVILKMICSGYMYGVVLSGYVFLDLFFGLIMMIPVIAFKSKITDIVYCGIIFLIITVFYDINTNYFIALGEIFSLANFSLVAKGLDVVNTDFISISQIVFTTILYLVFLGSIIWINLSKKFKTEIPAKFYKKSLLFTGLLGLLVVFLSATSLTLAEHQERHDGNETIDSITIAKGYNFKQLGMLPYYWKEVEYFLFDKDHNVTPTVGQANQMTGILKDYNVFTIMIETGAKVMANEYLTPNLYSLMNNGVNCSTNYCKNKTNMSEYIGMCGNYPTTGLSIDSSDDLFFSMPNLLNDDYETMYFHDVSSDKDIYRRRTLMPNIGFENVYLREEIHPNSDSWEWNGSYTLDTKTVGFVADTVIKKGETSKFYAYWSTLQMHGPYYYRFNQAILNELYSAKLETAKNEGYWVNPLADEKANVQKCMETYMMAVMDFDAALGIMIDKFKAAGLYDSTLFVLFGDHDVYYPAPDGDIISQKIYDCEGLNNAQLYETILVFSNKTLKEKYHNNYKTDTCDFEAFTSPYVICPTILDLLGHEYEDTYYLSTSIFDSRYGNEPNVFYSIELSSFFNNDFWSDGVKIVDVYNEEASQEAFMQALRKTRDKVKAIDSFYSNL